MSNFLWGGTSVSKGLHLAKWEMLTWPYAVGGWNIKDLKGFNDALRTQNLWIALIRSGLWSHVLKEKYMRNHSLIDWLRQGA